MASPLTRQNRPDYFEPKVVELYRHLFHTVSDDDIDDFVPSEGFWREFFLHKPDKQRLYDVLEPLTADNLVHIQTQTQLFFRRAIEEAGSGRSPQNENALDNLTGFLSAVLTKRYTNPNTDVIEVLAGLDNIDKVVSDLVQGLERIIHQSNNAHFRHKAIMTTLALVSGLYQTTLVTYFVHRDLFPALMKYTHDMADLAPEAMILLGLLANYNKFESQNVYQIRLEDYVNAKTISRLADSFIEVSKTIRNQFVSIQDDSPTPWTISSTLSMVGLRSLTPEAKKPQPPTEEEAKILFDDLPPTEVSIILSAYSFVNANKIFVSQVASTKSGQDVVESPLAAFLSLTSYLCHHAHRNDRSVKYATLSLLILRVLSEDQLLIKRLSSPESKIAIRLARQRPPLLPHIDRPRIPTTAILDICSDTITHNLRKRLNTPLFSVVLQILVRIVTHLDMGRIRLQHHWAQTWSSLFSLLRFLTQYSSDLAFSSAAHQIRNEICTPLVSLLAFCLSRGDNFLPDPSSYDDLFYKLIETSAILSKFKTAYCRNTIQSVHPATETTMVVPALTSSAATAGYKEPDVQLQISINALLSVTIHYQNILSSRSKSTKAHQSPTTIQKIIREGYDTLPDIGTSPVIIGVTMNDTTNINQNSSNVVQNNNNNNNRSNTPMQIIPTAIKTTTTATDFGTWTKFRESEWKNEIKKIQRIVVDDVIMGVCLKS